MISDPVASMAQSPAFTQWGWPLPYQRVSDASIKWLKEKGWWPLELAISQPSQDCQLQLGRGFSRARGLEVVVNAFLSGPAINEAAVAGRVQAGLEGNFPYTTLLSRSFPVRCVAIVNPN